MNATKSTWTLVGLAMIMMFSGVLSTRCDKHNSSNVRGGGEPMEIVEEGECYIMNGFATCSIANAACHECDHHTSNSTTIMVTAKNPVYKLEKNGLCGKKWVGGKCKQRSDLSWYCYSPVHTTGDNCDNVSVRVKQ